MTYIGNSQLLVVSVQFCVTPFYGQIYNTTSLLVL